MICLYRDAGCPYAHRIAALLYLLGEPFEDRSCRIGEEPQGLRAVSPAGRIPALAEGEVALYDSTVIGAYLAETRGWPAYAADPGARATERLLARRFDELVAGPLMAALPGAASVPAAELDELDRLATGLGPPRTCWLAIALGPFASLLAEYAPALAAAIAARPHLGGWMTYGAGLEAVQRTAVSVAFAPGFTRSALHSSARP